MAKQVFRPNEIKSKPGDKVTLKLIHDYAPVVHKEEKVEPAYKGPTAEELRRDAEAFKTGWEIEKKHMLEEAQKSADDIVKKAEEAAFAEVKRQTDQAQIIKTDAEKQAQDIIAKARSEAQAILDNARKEEEEIKSGASQSGYDEGYKNGYSNGEDEIKLLVERLHKIIEAVMARREEILKDTETQIVELVILMTRKVVKIISENQKSVIMSNVLAALKKVKTRGQVNLHVNLEDLKVTSEHINDFIKRLENIEGITVLEDSTVDKGGCIVETDFGAIDARISSQLGELESKIMEISPIKNISKSASGLDV